MGNRFSYIYMLEYSGSSLIYIGSTVNPKSRLAEHYKMLPYHRFPNDTQIKQTIIDVVPEYNSRYWERFYIDYFKFLGLKLRNYQPINQLYILKTHYVSVQEYMELYSVRKCDIVRMASTKKIKSSGTIGSKMRVDKNHSPLFSRFYVNKKKA